MGSLLPSNRFSPNPVGVETEAVGVLSMGGGSVEIWVISKSSGDEDSRPCKAEEGPLILTWEAGRS